MKNKRLIITVTAVVLFVLGPAGQGQIEQDALGELLKQANEDFAQANATEDAREAEKLYEKSILAFEKIISQGQVKNAKLYYNLANAYLLKGSLGRAILNYRRAEKLDNSDADIQKNLAFARSKRVDKVGVKTQKQVMRTLLFWHYDFSMKMKFLLSCIFFGILCICLAVMTWRGAKSLCKGPAVICFILLLCFGLSVVIEARTQARQISGVITSSEVTARQGDGQNYPPSFKEPLHEGTEFDVLEKRTRWLHIRLFDGSDAWIPEDSAELI